MRLVRLASVGFVTIALAAVVSNAPAKSATASANPLEPSGVLCSPWEAVAQVDDSRLSLRARNAAQTQPLMVRMMGLISKPGGSAVYESLTPPERSEFDDLRRQVIVLKMVPITFGRYFEDVRVIAELAEVAQIDDLYGVDRSTLSADNPRLFDLNILDALRAADVDPPEGKAPDPRNGCVMSASLFMLEHFNMSEMAKEPTNVGMLKLILDLRRLETLLRISSKQLELNGIELSNPDFANGIPLIGRQFDAWLAQQTKAVQATAIVYRAIEDQLPAEEEHELSSLATKADAIKENYRAQSEH